MIVDEGEAPSAHGGTAEGWARLYLDSIQSIPEQLSPDLRGRQAHESDDDGDGDYPDGLGITGNSIRQNGNRTLRCDIWITSSWILGREPRLSLHVAESWDFYSPDIR